MMEYSFCYPDYSSKWSDLSSGKAAWEFSGKMPFRRLKVENIVPAKLCHFQHFLPNLAVFHCLCMNGRAGQAWAALPLTLKTWLWEPQRPDAGEGPAARMRGES